MGVQVIAGAASPVLSLPARESEVRLAGRKTVASLSLRIVILALDEKY
jgi:hypothetical protein